jgi:hypothetical protein
MHKEVREIRKKLKRQGWRFRQAKGPYELAIPPDKAKSPVKLPSSPGGRRWKQNLTGELRKSGADL